MGCGGWVVMDGAMHGMGGEPCDACMDKSEKLEDLFGRLHCICPVNDCTSGTQYYVQLIIIVIVSQSSGSMHACMSTSLRQSISQMTSSGVPRSLDEMIFGRESFLLDRQSASRSGARAAGQTTTSQVTQHTAPTI